MPAETIRLAAEIVRVKAQVVWGHRGRQTSVTELRRQRRAERGRGGQDATQVDVDRTAAGRRPDLVDCEFTATGPDQLS